MMRNLFIIAFLLLLLSCSSEEKKVLPENVLAPEKFTSVMIDVQIAEGMRAQGVEIITPDKGGKGAYDKIFQKHQITEQTFELSYNYYLDHPDKMEMIYEQVLDSLSKLDAEVKQRFSAERKARADSIKAAGQKN